MPEFAAAETEYVLAGALYGLRVVVLGFDGVLTVGRWTPAHQTIAFNKTIGYQMLILDFNCLVVYQRPLVFILNIHFI